MDSSPPGSPVPGILQARTLEWVAISFSNAWKWKNKAKSLSRVRLLVTPWTAAHQAPPSMGFSRQEYWSGLPLPSLNNTIVAIKFCFSQNNSYLSGIHKYTYIWDRVTFISWLCPSCHAYLHKNDPSYVHPQIIWNVTHETYLSN